MNYFRRSSVFHGGREVIRRKHIFKPLRNLEQICKLVQVEIEYKCPLGPTESENMFQRIKKIPKKKDTSKPQRDSYFAISLPIKDLIT